jgi:hypothetical protein
MDDSLEPADRARVDDTIDAIEVSIPVKKDWPKVVFITIWLVGWVIGGVYAIRRLLNGSDAHAEGFLVCWLIAWAAGCVFGSARWLWNVAGIERARFRNDSVLIRREVFGIGITREYDAGSVGKLRLTEDFHKGSYPRRDPGVRDARISFDYEETEVRFGLRLDRGEAARIILKIQKRFAFTRN